MCRKNIHLSIFIGSIFLLGILPNAYGYGSDSSGQDQGYGATSASSGQYQGGYGASSPKQNQGGYGSGSYSSAGTTSQRNIYGYDVSAYGGQYRDIWYGSKIYNGLQGAEITKEKRGQEPEITQEREIDTGFQDSEMVQFKKEIDQYIGRK